MPRIQGTTGSRGFGTATRNNQGPRVILLSPPGDLGQIVVRSLDALNAETLLICEPRSSIRLSFLVRRTLLAREHVFEHPEWIAETINAEHEKAPVDVVIATSVVGLQVLAKIRDQIAPPVFPMADSALLSRLNDKWKFAAICAECDVETPRTLHYAQPTDIDYDQVASELGYPCVVKPLDASGGDGVRVVRSASSLSANLVAQARYLERGFLLQTFALGLDVGVSVFALDGEIRHWTTFICDGFWSTRFCEIPALLDAASRIVKHIRFTGVANFDARLNPETGEILLLECNPRFFRRVGAARHCGLDFVSAGLASLGVTRAKPVASLVQGQHLSARDVFSAAGFKMIFGGGYSLKAVQGEALDFLRDPVPGLGSFAKETLNSFRSLVGRRNEPHARAR